MNMFTKFEALCEIIRDLEDLVQPEDTGHIRTAISVLEDQRDGLRQQLNDLYKVKV